jgi:membrane-associated protein
LDKIIWAMIFIPGALAIYGSWKASRGSQASAEPPAAQ